ncbi:hypothetical protein [Bacillus marasmi]|uniref:hypothetical protein n=1 Tax=Bacillus marasmi TaxID=1926279 RepID=UPI0011C8FCE0|nr:hypothetical protein [Bacillus marasmi]
MKKRILWFIGIAICALVVFHLSKMAFLHLGQAPFSQDITQVHHQVVMHSFDKGGLGHFNEPRHGIEVHQRFVGGHHTHHGTFFPILFDLGLIIAGLALLKFAGKKSLVKGIGAALLFIGLWTLLPNWLALLFLLMGGYYWYKTREKAEETMDVISEYVSVPTQKLDFLDEWERSINKEVK